MWDGLFCSVVWDGLFSSLFSLPGPRYVGKTVTNDLDLYVDTCSNNHDL